MRQFAAAATVTLASAVTPFEFYFIEWMAEYNKNYATVEEYNFRLA
jgi:hypothetical protein